MNITGFEIIEKVGEIGAMAIYKARQGTLDRIVTLKVLESKLSNVGEVKDFVHEGQSAAAFKHPSVAEVYAIGEEEGVFYLAMEYIKGRTLREIVNQEGLFPAKRAMKVAEQVAEALKAAWLTAKLVHRDLCSDNIMITDDGWVKVTGFGQVRPVDFVTLEAFIRAGLISPTLNFMSPEQAEQKKDIDTRADMYSLGAVLYHLVTGQIPFKDSPPIVAMKQHLHDRLPHPRDINRTLPPIVAQLIIKLMMKLPENRYKNWDEVLADIKKVSSGRIIAVPPGWEERSTIMGIQRHTTKAQSIKPVEPPRPKLPLWLVIPVWVFIALSWLFFVCCLFRPQIEKTFKKQSAGKEAVAAPKN